MKRKLSEDPYDAPHDNKRVELADPDDQAQALSVTPPIPAPIPFLPPFPNPLNDPPTNSVFTQAQGSSSGLARRQPQSFHPDHLHDESQMNSGTQAAFTNQPEAPSSPTAHSEAQSSHLPPPNNLLLDRDVYDQPADQSEALSSGGARREHRGVPLGHVDNNGTQGAFADHIEVSASSAAATPRKGFHAHHLHNGSHHGNSDSLQAGKGHSFQDSPGTTYPSSKEQDAVKAEDPSMAEPGQAPTMKTAGERWYPDRIDFGDDSDDDESEDEWGHKMTQQAMEEQGKMSKVQKVDCGPNDMPRDRQGKPLEKGLAGASVQSWSQPKRPERPAPISLFSGVDWDYHRAFRHVGVKTQAKRKEHLRTIERCWPGVDLRNLLPRAQRHSRLPADPLDWAASML